MDTLPAEMKLAIFGQLSNNHLLSCRRVCRSWNRYIGAQFGDRFQVWLEPSRQLFKEQLVDTFMRLGRDVLDSRKLIGDEEEEEEEGDEEQQRQEQQPHRLHWFGGRLTFWQMANLIDYWDRQLEAMVHRPPEVLDGALSAVHSLRIKGSLVFHRRFYSCRDEHGEELDEDGFLRLVLRQPTTYGLTFAAVRVMLRYHTPSLAAIHLATRAITAESVRQLLTDNSSSSSSLTDIYLEGPEECPVSVAKQIRELKQQQQQQQNSKAQTQIHFE